MRTVKMDKMSEVILAKILINNLHEFLISPRETGTSKANLYVNFMFHPSTKVDIKINNCENINTVIKITVILCSKQNFFIFCHQNTNILQ